jgi:hypothetical protein
MSLLRLLTTGKSLVGVGEAEGRYRLTTQRLLPHFGSPINPFRGRGESDPAQTEDALSRTLEETATPARPLSSGGKQSLELGQPAAPQRPGRTVRPSTVSSGRSFLWAIGMKVTVTLGAWTSRFRGMFERPRAETTSSALPRFTKQPVQGELSLDRITVVRNDLSEADLEVIPARVVQAQPSGALDLPAEPQARIPDSSWGRMKTRMFGAGKDVA